jgi:hypothetical protein
LFGCIQTDNQNLLLGKLKTLEVITPSSSKSTLFNYIYDQNGYLTNLQSDSLQYIIGKKIGNVVIITAISIDADPFLSATTKFKIYIDAGDRILAINFLDTLTLEEFPFLSVSYDSINELDTITTKGSPAYTHDISGFNYEFDGNNYLKQNISWYIYSGLDVFYLDTATYTYTSILNDNFIPSQIPFLSIAYPVAGNTQDDLLLNLMEINGYHVYKRNKNLIQSIISSNYGYVTNYSYVINSFGQVSEMHISNSDGTGESTIYKMTYY